MKPPVDGSTTWELVLLSIGVIIVLLEAARGWRLGIARQVVRLVALIASYTVARLAGPAALPFGRALVHWPDPLLSVLGGAILGLLCYTALSTAGAFLFKRTAQQASAPLRLLYGVGGSVIGLCFGLLFVWLIFLSLRLVGSVAEAQLPARESLVSPSTQPVWHRRLQFSGGQVSTAPTPNPLTKTLATMKRSLENGIVGGNLKSTDPVPGSLYLRLERLGEVSSNPTAIERFLTYPGARQLSENPRIVALRNDPTVLQLVSQGRILDLLHNQRLLDAANDRALRAELSKFDLDRALDYALAK